MKNEVACFRWGVVAFAVGGIVELVDVVARYLPLRLAGSAMMAAGMTLAALALLRGQDRHGKDGEG